MSHSFGANVTQIGFFSFRTYIYIFFSGLADIFC